MITFEIIVFEIFRVNTSFYQLYCAKVHYKMTKVARSIDKVVKLLDVLDRHMKEKECKHTPNELLTEVEN